VDSVRTNQYIAALQSEAQNGDVALKACCETEVSGDTVISLRFLLASPIKRAGKRLLRQSFQQDTNNKNSAIILRVVATAFVAGRAA